MFLYAAFATETEASRAVQELLDEHFDEDAIEIVVDRDGLEYLVPIHHDTGVIRGVAVGAAAGMLAGVGFDRFVTDSGGAAALIGALLGALLGVLAGLGVWRDNADFSHNHIHGGMAFVGVATDSREQLARLALRRAGAERIFARRR